MKKQGQDKTKQEKMKKVGKIISIDMWIWIWM